MGKLTAHDLLDAMLVLIAAASFLYAVIREHQSKRENRGIKGWKFRAMWREYADEHDIKINGEDSD